MSDQVHQDITALNTSLTDLSSQISSIATELQNLQASKPVGSTISDADAATLHTLATNAAQADAAAKALVQPIVNPTGTDTNTTSGAAANTTVSGSTGDTVSGSAS